MEGKVDEWGKVDSKVLVLLYKKSCQWWMAAF